MVKGERLAWEKKKQEAATRARAAVEKQLLAAAGSF